jgi:hypothetical protein
MIQNNETSFLYFLFFYVRSKTHKFWIQVSGAAEDTNIV